MLRPLPFVALLLPLLATSASAEEVGGTTVASTTPVAEGSSSAPPSPPSLAERARDAGTKLRAVEAQTFRVQAELRGARRGKDAARIACLDSLLTRLHVAARDGRVRQEAIEGARKVGDAETEAREVVRLAYLADRADRIFRASGLCRTSSVVVVQGPNGTQVRASTPSLPDAAAYPPAAYPPAERTDAPARRR